MQLASLLLVAVMLSGCTITIDKTNSDGGPSSIADPTSDPSTEQEDQGGGKAPPQLSFTKNTGDGRTIWTVTKISNGPVAWTDLEIYCDETGQAPGGSPQEGDVKAGNKITCPSGDRLFIYHTPTETMMYNSS